MEEDGCLRREVEGQSVGLASPRTHNRQASQDVVSTEDAPCSSLRLHPYSEGAMMPLCWAPSLEAWEWSLQIEMGLSLGQGHVGLTMFSAHCGQLLTVHYSS